MNIEGDFMDETAKLMRAKMYIDKLANGINPIDDTLASDTDVINNVRVSRCLFYVSEVLESVIDNKINNGGKKTKKMPFCLPAEKRNQFPISDIPLTVSEITNCLNSLADLELCKKLNVAHITSWLVEAGMLEIAVRFDGKNVKLPSAIGSEIGIFTEERTGQHGAYSVVLYDKNAQQFIIDNLDAIIEHNQKQTSKS